MFDIIKSIKTYKYYDKFFNKLESVLLSSFSKQHQKVIRNNLIRNKSLSF